MLIAQLTDVHVRSAEDDLRTGGRENGGLRAAIAKLNSLTPRPDLVMITGDLTVGGEPAEYDELVRILAGLQIRACLTIGNHDVRANFANVPAFRTACDENGFAQQSIDDLPVRVLMLDSSSDDHHQGEFCETRRRWLAARLAEAPGKPTLLGLHHPPFDTGFVAMDGSGPGWAYGLIGELRKHPQVVGIVCGHLHRSIQTVVEGRVVSVCPSTTSQVALDLDPSSSLDSMLAAGFGVEEPPCFQLHLWTGTRLVTHGVFVGDFARSRGVDIRMHPEMSVGKYQGKWMSREAAGAR